MSGTHAVTQRETTSSHSMKGEKTPHAQAERKDLLEETDIGIGEDEEEHEVFKKTSDGVDFRTVGWPVASIIFLKREFSFRSLDYSVVRSQVTGHR